MVQKGLLLLSSRDGEGDINYDQYWNIDMPHFQDMEGLIVTLQSIEFPNTVYPINEYNQYVYFTENGVNFSFFLTPNNYTGTTFALAIQTAMNLTAATATYACTYNTLSNRLTFTSTALTFAFVDGLNNINEEMGFSSTGSGAEVATTLEGEFPIIISGTNYVDIVSNLSNHSYSKTTTAGVLARVPVDVGFGSVVFYHPPAAMAIPVFIRDLNVIQFRLLDDKGKPWVLPRNSHISYTVAWEAYL